MFNANTNLTAYFTDALIVSNTIRFDTEANGGITASFTFTDNSGDITGTDTAVNGVAGTSYEASTIRIDFDAVATSLLLKLSANVSEDITPPSKSIRIVEAS